MLIEFFNTVKKSGVNVSLKELLDLIKALDSNLINRSTEDFYFLSRSIMVKDEKYYDKFDKAFGIFFKGFGGSLIRNDKYPTPFKPSLLDLLLSNQEHQHTWYQNQGLF